MSSVNNKVFKHYYNFDILGGFDARIKKILNSKLRTLQSLLQCLKEKWDHNFMMSNEIIAFTTT
jgi:hypothetical protein